MNLEDKLHEWVCHGHTNSNPTEGPVFQEKANNSLKMGIQFKCSNGWLQRLSSNMT
jgi:hypothetical protein